MPAPKQPESPFSIRLFTAFGIPIRANFTFLIFLVWVAYISLPNAAVGVLMALALFGCVLLHELGHALVARRYGVQTSDITLYFMGGVAMLQTKPKPVAEFWIALAGPAVNVVIAALLLPIVIAGHHDFNQLAGGIKAASMIEWIFTANVILAIFNMIPAFPMDGGRVLRAVLAMALPEQRATTIAAGVGQLIAVCMLVIGLFTQNVVLMLVSVVVMLGAGQEVSVGRTRSMLSGHTVQEAMQSQFRTIESGTSLEAAAHILVEGSQHDFPVVAGEEIIGVLTRTDVARGLATDGPSGYVAGSMRRNFIRILAEMPLETAIEMFGANEPGPLLVMEEDRLLGMLSREGVSEFMLLQDARNRSRSQSLRR